MKFNLSFSDYDNYEIDIKVKRAGESRANNDAAGVLLAELATLLCFEHINAEKEGRDATSKRARDASLSLYDAANKCGYFDDVNDADDADK